MSNDTTELAAATPASLSAEEGRIYATLSKITDSWERRAQVKKADLLRQLDFHAELPDFHAPLLPFADHPRFVDATETERSRLLTYGWLTFNQKAIDIERNVLVPSCMLLLDRCSGFGATITREVVGQTLVDESFHILLVQQANQLTAVRRGLDRPALPLCNMVERMRSYQKRCSESWQRDLTVIGAAIVTEVFIKGYLSQLSRVEGIQPLSIVTTQAHLTDEGVHASIFNLLAGLIYQQLSEREREFFVDILIHAMDWFSDPEFTMWQTVVATLKLPRGQNMLAECQAVYHPVIDYTALIEFLQRIGADHVEGRILRHRDRASLQSHTSSL